ncbi:MAG TPA: YsnF/AvaK domain-containing protein [Stellaceae bacterium]|jgi:stress response protein YsnF
MDGHNVVAVYKSRADAEMARDRLIEFGVPQVDIRMSDTAAPTGAAGPAVGQAAVAGEHRAGFWDWLFGRDVPERDRGWYEANLREGRTVVSVLVRNEAERERIADILDEFDPVEYTGTAEAWAPGAATAAPMASTPMAEPRAEAPLRAGSVSGERSAFETGQQDEQVIPVVKEELAVGKRASERHYRIRTYVVETPVEQEVTLRDERVIVERRPVSGEGAIGAVEMPQEREYEVTERHEEPVVEKRARETEEVVVRREANERTERVRDTVRETKVDVGNETGGVVENREGTLPNRKP